MQSRQILLNSCARAATAAESRFRIDVPLVPSSATRVIALDSGAHKTVEAGGRETWHHTRFYRVAHHGGKTECLTLTAFGGSGTLTLAPELEGVDTVVMVATCDDGAAEAATIAAACTVRGVMTAGLVISPGDVTLALAALRPHARVLMAPADESDLVDLLRAIRA